MSLHGIALALVLTLSSCACPHEGGAPSAAEPAPERPREARDGGNEEGGAPPPPASLCVHQRRADLGAPVHREKGGKGGFVRLDECTRLAPIEGDDRWLRAAFPVVEGRTEGWISKRYVMDCGPCDGDAGADEVVDEWPPQPRGMCREAGARGNERLVVTDPVDVAKVGAGAKGRAGSRVTILSFNVWELYDGQGEASYLSPRPGSATPAKQYEGRLSALGGALRRHDVDVLLLQEVEGAEVACALASRAWPRSGWTCFGAPARLGGHPQNVAVATFHIFRCEYT